MPKFSMPESDKAEICRAIYSLRDELEERAERLWDACYVDLDMSDSVHYTTPREQELLDALGEGGIEEKTEAAIGKILGIVERLFDDYVNGDPADGTGGL